MADEEALAVVLGVDEPARDVVGGVAGQLLVAGDLAPFSSFA
jgi:hypothetical protein